MRYSHPTQISRSNFFASLEWTGERVVCKDVNVRGDTYPVAWADDGELYVGVGDPNCAVIDGRFVTSVQMDAETKTKHYPAICGMVVDKISGSGENFSVSRVNDLPGFIGWGGHGPKPTGMVCVDGNLYMVAQNLLGWKPPRYGNNSQHGSDATVLKSTDKGKSWDPDLNSLLDDFQKEHFCKETWDWGTGPEQRGSFKDFKPMFPGSWFGGASFVQFGQNNGTAVDGYVYAVSSDHWDNGSDMRLGRVPKDKVLDIGSWEFAVTDDGGMDVSWVSNLYKSKPVLAIDRHVSTPEMVYLPSAKKYLTVTWGLHTDFYATHGSELTVLESDNPWGPFRLVHYDWMWYKEEAGFYCPRIPLKWFDESTMTGHMLISGNWCTYEKYYLPQTMPFRLNLVADRTKNFW